MVNSSDPKCQAYVTMFITDPSKASAAVAAPAPPTPAERQQAAALMETAQQRMQQRTELLRRLAVREAAVPAGDAQQKAALRRYVELLVALVWRTQELVQHPEVVEALEHDTAAQQLLQLCFTDPVQGAEDAWFQAFVDGRLGKAVYSAMINAGMLRSK